MYAKLMKDIKGSGTPQPGSSAYPHLKNQATWAEMAEAMNASEGFPLSKSKLEELHKDVLCASEQATLDSTHGKLIPIQLHLTKGLQALKESAVFSPFSCMKWS